MSSPPPTSISKRRSSRFATESQSSYLGFCWLLLSCRWNPRPVSNLLNPGCSTCCPRQVRRRWTEGCLIRMQQRANALRDLFDLRIASSSSIVQHFSRAVHCFTRTSRTSPNSCCTASVSPHASSNEKAHRGPAAERDMHCTHILNAVPNTAPHFLSNQDAANPNAMPKPHAYAKSRSPARGPHDEFLMPDAAAAAAAVGTPLSISVSTISRPERLG